MKEFTIRLCNAETSTKEMYDYLIKRFGRERDLENNRVWYLGRDYSTPYDSSHLTVTFQGSPTAKNTWMMLEHPYVAIKEVSNSDALAADNTFNELFA